MRRQDIQLRAAARQGDTCASLEMARRYLLGIGDFPRNLQSGLEYLSKPGARGGQDADRLVAECLGLEEILQYGCLGMLQRAAEFNPVAQVKFAAWMLACGEEAQAVLHLKKASRAGRNSATRALIACGDLAAADRLRIMLQCLQEGEGLDARGILLASARQALACRNVGRLTCALAAAVQLGSSVDREICELVCSAVDLAQADGGCLAGLTADSIEACLEQRCAESHAASWFTLGRALSGISCGSLAPERLVRRLNLRKGSALLVRAADAGYGTAWLHLHRLSDDYRSSVANPQMGRFYLEKAAASGEPEAQRRLGAVMLKESRSLSDTEQGIAWLFEAARQHDGHAESLLASLVLPVDGQDAAAWAAIARIETLDAWLAMRLRVSRRFGLTKLEALTLEPVEGERPWGVVVGRNPFISQTRVSAPRAIPALSVEALADLHSAADFVRRRRRDGAALEGDLRGRCTSQVRTFNQLKLDERLFFASATSSVREAVRIGSRWAHRTKDTLSLALAN